MLLKTNMIRYTARQQQIVLSENDDPRKQIAHAHIFTE